MHHMVHNICIYTDIYLLNASTRLSSGGSVWCTRVTVIEHAAMHGQLYMGAFTVPVIFPERSQNILK
jgi:hypothetical protein